MPKQSLSHDWTSSKGPTDGLETNSVPNIAHMQSVASSGATTYSSSCSPCVSAEHSDTLQVQQTYSVPNEGASFAGTCTTCNQKCVHTSLNPLLPNGPHFALTPSAISTADSTPTANSALVAATEQCYARAPMLSSYIPLRTTGGGVTDPLTGTSYYSIATPTKVDVTGDVFLQTFSTSLLADEEHSRSRIDAIPRETAIAPCQATSTTQSSVATCVPASMAPPGPSEQRVTGSGACVGAAIPQTCLLPSIPYITGDHHMEKCGDGAPKVCNGATALTAVQQPGMLHNHAGGTTRIIPSQLSRGGGGTERRASTPKSYAPKFETTPRACVFINGTQICQASSCTATIHSHGSEPCGSPPKQYEQQTLFTSPATSCRASPSPSYKGSVQPQDFQRLDSTATARRIVTNEMQASQAVGCAATTNSCGSESCASSSKQHEKQTLLMSPATSRRGSPSPTCRRLSESDASNRRITSSGPETLQALPSMAEDCLIPQPVTPHAHVRRNRLLRKGNKRSDEIFRRRNNRREEILRYFD